MTDLAQRYRRPSRLSRSVVVTVAVALAAIIVGLIVWAAFRHATPVVTSQLNTFRAVDDHSVVASITVWRVEDDTEAQCRLSAIAPDHQVVGVHVLEVIEGPKTQTIDVELRTERRATSIHLEGCTAPDQQRPR